MQSIIDQFQLENSVLLPEAIKVGIINQSFCLKSAVEGGKSYFLQRINHNIFQDVEGLQNNIERVTSHIRQLLIEAGETDVERKVLRVVPTNNFLWMPTMRMICFLPLVLQVVERLIPLSHWLCVH